MIFLQKLGQLVKILPGTSHVQKLSNSEQVSECISSLQKL